MAKKQKPLSRRHFLKASAAAGLVAGLPQAALAEPSAFQWASADNESRYPIENQKWLLKAKSNTVPYEGLITSLKSTSRYVCEVEGQLPVDLYGSLLRAGPGLFERGDMRRRILIDADGMVRRFNFYNGMATFESQHVQTPKYKAEEKEGRYIYPSFAMKAPPSDYSILANSVTNLKNQASVTVFEFGGRMFVTDELQALTELDPATLKTIGETTLLKDGDLKYCAHHRITHFGEKLLHLTAISPISRQTKVYTFNEKFENIHTTDSVKIQRNFHDWVVTEDYFVFVLPPLFLSRTGMALAVIGRGTVADALYFDTDQKTKILLIPRNGGKEKIFELLHSLDTWHSINAYQNEAKEVVVDFVSARSRADVVSNKSYMAKVMRGEMPITKETRPSSATRVFINIETEKVRYNVDYFNLKSIEMPTVDQRKIGLKHEDAFFISGQEALDNKLVRLNLKNYAIDSYDFGSNHFVTEPIFAPSAVSASGYILSEVYSHAIKKSYLAIFNSQNLSSGPIAKVILNHHLPIGFHGFWRPGY